MQYLFVARRCGRLANRLVLFANVLAYAMAGGHRLVNFTFHSYASDFERTRDDLLCRFPVKPARSQLLSTLLFPLRELVRRTRCCYHLVRLASKTLPKLSRFAVTIKEPPHQQVVELGASDYLEQVGQAKFVFLYGWTFRDVDNVRTHADQLRHYFRPIATHRQLVDDTLRNLRKKVDVVIGIHIRHGDYRDWLGGRYFFPFTFYVECMKRMELLLPGKQVGFLICSNEQQDERLLSTFQWQAGPGTAVGDLYALAECDYLIGPLSTFSQWASFYGEVPLFHLQQRALRFQLSDFHVSYLDHLPG